MLLRSSLLSALFIAVSATSAHAICVANYLVMDTATAGSTLTTYNFALSAGCVTTNEFEQLLVPYFSDAGITTITVPQGWTYTISTSDIFNLGAETLEFIPLSPLTGLPYGTQVTGISFSSPFSPVNGPIGTTQSISGTTISDPPIPGSPNTIKALANAAVPEPSTIALSVFGIVLLGVLARRKLLTA